MYETRITNLDELKQRLRTEWTKLDHFRHSTVSGDFLSLQMLST